ncbi:helix-turn-helix domain-containing protein, partial [Kocuria palustris]
MSTQRNIVIARSVIDQGLTTTQAAEKFGISRQWVHVLVTRYRAGGSQAMHPGSKAPRRSPQRIPPPLRERIITLRTELTAQGADAGPETIAWHLHQEGLRVPSTSTIRRILH